ncbi:hypothetical protein TAMA11512_20380 [Selenomonas sp. TAMA-11512]|uniref:cell division protein FtsA n=1 Tax=Selenomonas sp. TAMA-11512 TaxID=3095337 RepID=UPI003089A05C|nr:hypothetical protein TAMA11512_20380 [Selenomonas sp. TAMA-11512]
MPKKKPDAQASPDMMMSLDETLIASYEESIAETAEKDVPHAEEVADSPKKASRADASSKRTAKPKAKTASAKKSASKKAGAAKHPAKADASGVNDTGSKENGRIKLHGEPVFALDIGTRSVIGIVAEKTDSHMMRILATVRREHKTRAMLDGQIHDVPQVADIIREVKNELIERVGPLTGASVAAAGRALYTMTAETEAELGGIVTDEEQRALDFAGVQAAQAKLATSKIMDDPSRYYCVGYSTIQYTLDGVPLKSLIGQRGKLAKATVIATFLPRQVIDSMQSALRDVQLDMRALTLEPIAAINVLIPPTMRHLNLALVDIGAGTSDVAITKNGSIVAYGMVPLAGDEITEAISQRYLLDFNVAEHVKRSASAGQAVKFTDILGSDYELSAADVISPVMPNIQSLADAIAKQILELNGDSPQAVMLVGGGAQTPALSALVAKALSIPENRVSVRHPDAVEGVESIPLELQTPDAVTPLGILKIASINLLHFLSVYVNDEEINLFNFRDLTVSDALLNAGIQLKKFNGKPGLGLMVTVNEEKKFFPGTLPSMARVLMDGEDTTLDTVVKEGARITVVAGDDGTTPEITLAEVLTVAPEFKLYINGREKRIRQGAVINGTPAEPGTLLKDGDVIESKEPRSLGEALNIAGYPPAGRKISYTLNGVPSHYTLKPEIILNDAPAILSMPIHEGDHVEYQTADEPQLSEVLDLKELQTFVRIIYNEQEFEIPSASLTLTVNGHKASPGTYLEDGADVRYDLEERKATTVNEALLAVGFEPPPATSRVTVSIFVNRRPAIFTDPVKNGDRLDIVIKPITQQSGLNDKGGATPGWLKQTAPIPSASSVIKSTSSAAGTGTTETQSAALSSPARPEKDTQAAAPKSRAAAWTAASSDTAAPPTESAPRLSDVSSSASSAPAGSAPKEGYPKTVSWGGIPHDYSNRR